MDWVYKKIPPFMYSRPNLVRLVVFTAIFALVFINIYKPFSSSQWYVVSEFMFFVYSSLIILTGVMVVVISRTIMYYYARKRGLKYGKYILWVLAEIFFMATFYTLYTLSLNKDREIMNVFEDSIINTSLVLLLPYTILILYFSWQEKKRQLQQLEENKTELPEKGEVLSFCDEKGELRLSVRRDALIYMEAADNYVMIWYMNKGALARFLLRNSLKALEETFTDSHILRCHRSYMVNFDHVKVIRRAKEGILLELGMNQVPDIPISKSYSERVTQYFINYSQ